MSASCWGGYACSVWDIAFGIVTPAGGGIPSGRGGSKFVDFAWTKLALGLNES